MILGSPSDSPLSEPGPAASVTLDRMLRQHGQSRAEYQAVADAPGHGIWGASLPRQLTYAGLDAAVDRLAKLFANSGLSMDSIVAIQLPHGVEAAVTLLAALRAGLIAMPLPPCGGELK